MAEPTGAPLLAATAFATAAGAACPVAAIVFAAEAAATMAEIGGVAAISGAMAVGMIGLGTAGVAAVVCALSLSLGAPANAPSLSLTMAGA